MENKIDRHTILQAGQRVFQVGQLCEPLPQILRFYFPDSKTHFNLSKQNMRVLFRLSWLRRLLICSLFIVTASIVVSAGARDFVDGASIILPVSVDRPLTVGLL